MRLCEKLLYVKIKAVAKLKKLHLWKLKTLSKQLLVWEVHTYLSIYFKFFFVRRPQRCIFSISLNIGELKHTRILRNLCCLTGVKSGFERLDLNFPSLLKKPLSLKNIEHALCEFDKYFRFIITKSEKGREYSEKKSRSYLDKKPCCKWCSNETSNAPYN